ncbi:CpaF/VirB11 family protein [Clostridium manihotivorum]|uniref:Type II secretion system protein E n=1 Tax=Clostridium manihotivorum TaxID=2320868 RepID=A0A3R5QYR4_9CLOT|nr:CpaF/VirB11 family protein [Clostridium manihotivorum]QAA32743.1 type II secretion system protein E [Clostridium manihotivorum]
MNNADLFFNSAKVIKEFPEILQEVQEYISNKYSTLLSDNPEEQKEQIKSYISKYLLDYHLGVKDLNFEELVEKLYSEMAEFSFITKYLFRNDVEEININQWKDIKITYSNGQILPTKEKFNSPEHALDVIRRLLHKSGMILDNSQPVVRGHLSNKIRITVFGNGVVDQDKGISASIRIVNPQKLDREDFIKNETVTEDMLDFLSASLRYGLSMCATGATSSGKTTLMSYLLSTIPDDKRIFTIENGTREFDLVKLDEKGNVINNVVHTVTRYSEDKRQNIDQEKLLESALTANPDYICVAEMKGGESFAAQEAARTGHAVITTTHANSCEATYYRMVTLCKMKYDINDDTLYNLVTEAFPIVLFTKKLEDNTRKIMEITECEILPDGKRQIYTLFRYNIKENKIVDGKLRIIGEYEKVNNISKSLQKRLLENGMPLNMLENLLKAGEA